MAKIAFSVRPMRALAIARPKPKRPKYMCSGIIAIR